jgi:lysophospholipase L1-like esterase
MPTKCISLLLWGCLSALVCGHLPTDSMQYIGRFDNSIDRQTEWPGSKIHFTVEAIETKLTLTLSALVTSNTHYFAAIEVNCVYSNRYEIFEGMNKIQFSIESTIPGQKYDLSVVKISEAHNGDSVGTMTWNEIEILGGNLLTREIAGETCDRGTSTTSPNLLFIGDSITAAYGVDGTDAYCHYTAATQNILESYATLVAKSVSANLQTIAWSGKGAVRNYGDPNPTSTEPMPIFYNRTLATDPTTYWTPSNFIPDVVIIALGANDYSTQPQPSDEDFQTALITLIQQLRVDFPSSSRGNGQLKVVLMCEPGAVGNQCVNIETVATSKTVDAVYVKIPNEAVVSYGCDYHPSVEAQVNIADIVIPVVKSLLA